MVFKRARQLCGMTGLLPSSHIIPGQFIQTTEHPVASGGFGDVWEGIYNDKRVAIKVPRPYRGDNEQKLRKVTRLVFLVPFDASVDYRH